VNRLYDDLEVICYSEEHKNTAFKVALPAIIFWVVGIPTMGLVLMCKNRKNEFYKDKLVKERYGFLLSGYRVPQAYYWEMVNNIRKIFIIFIQVFLLQIG
jgi:hypothetical protein